MNAERWRVKRRETNEGRRIKGKEEKVRNKRKKGKKDESRGE